MIKKIGVLSGVLTATALMAAAAVPASASQAGPTRPASNTRPAPAPPGSQTQYNPTRPLGDWTHFERIMTSDGTVKGVPK
jgi:hypothetical protein